MVLDFVTVLLVSSTSAAFFFTTGIIFVLIAQKVPFSHHSQLWYCLLSIGLIDLHLILGLSVCSSLVCLTPVNSTNSKHCMYSNIIPNPVDCDASIRMACGNLSSAKVNSYFYVSKAPNITLKLMCFTLGLPSRG